MRASAPTKRRVTWWPLAVIVLSACVFCWPVFAGRIMLPADMCLLMLPWKALQSQFPDFHRAHNPMLDPIQQYLPWRFYAVESVRQGIIPLWNPYAFCGTPFLANLQSTVLYPLNTLFLITGARHGFGISAILHLILGGVFMYALLRTMALSVSASLLGALVLMFNGWTVAWLEYPTLSLWVFMWLPALLLCYEYALRQPRSHWSVLCALLVGMQFLGGHLQISAYVLIAFALYVLVRVIARHGHQASRTRAIGIAVTALSLGVALAAAQLLPTIELARQSGRVAHGAGAAMQTAFPLSHFILYLVPNFLGNPVDYNYWGFVRDQSAFNFFETACYVGVLPLFLAAFAFTGRRLWQLWFFAALTLFAFLAAVGSPVYLLMYYLAPGFRELAGLGRVLCLAAFGLAGLAAIGLDALLERKPISRTRLHVICAAFACLFIAAARVGFHPYIKLLDNDLRLESYLKHQAAIAFAVIALSALLIDLRVRGKLGTSATGVIALALVIADLFAFGVNFNPFTDARMAYPKTDAIRWLQESAGHERVTSLASEGFLDWMPHNSPMVFGLRDIHGSDSLRIRRSFDLVSGPKLEQASYPPPDSPLMDALAVRYLLTRRPVGGNWKLVRDGEVPIYENGEVLPRAFVVSDFSIGPDESFADLLAEGAKELREKALLAPDPTLLEIPSRGVHPPQAPVTFDRDAPDQVIVTAQPEKSGLLVLLDSYYPGWRARVYQTPVAIHRADYGFRGVEIPAGKQVVTFTYEPATFRIGLFISLIACAVLASAGTCVYLRR